MHTNQITRGARVTSAVSVLLPFNKSIKFASQEISGKPEYLYQKLELWRLYSCIFEEIEECCPDLVLLPGRPTLTLSQTTPIPRTELSPDTTYKSKMGHCIIGNID